MKTPDAATVDSLPVAKWEVVEGYACPSCGSMEWGTPDPFDAVKVKRCSDCGTRFRLDPEKADEHGC